MTIKNLCKSPLIGALICLTIGVYSAFPLYAQSNEALAPTYTKPRKDLVLYDDLVPRPVSSLMEVAPANPIVVLQIRDAAEALALVEDSKAWQQIREAPIWEMVWAFLEMQTEVKESHRLIRPGLSVFSRLLGREVLLVVPEFRGLLELSPTLLVQIDRSDDLGDTLAAAIEVALANIPNTSSREHNGYAYQVTAPFGPGLRLSFGMTENLLIVSLGESTIKTVIDLYSGEAEESLAHDTKFAQVIARFQTDNSLTDFQSMFYVDIAAITEFAKMMYPMVKDQADMPPPIKSVADQAIEWLDLVQSVTASANITKDGMLSQSYVQFNPEATANNFLAMLQAPPITHDSIQFVPVDAAAYAVSNLIDLPKLWEMAMGVIDTMPPEVSEQILTGLDAMQAQFNISIEKNLLSWMGNELALINQSNSVFIPGGGSESNLQHIAASLPRLAVLIETTDTTLATEGLGLISELITQILASTSGLALQWQTADYSGVLIRTAEIPELQIQPGYAVTDKYVIIALDAALLRSVLDCAAGRSENLSALTQFQELRALTPDMVNTIGYANPLRSLNSGLDAFMETVSSDIDAEYQELAQALLAQVGELVKAVAKVFIGQIQYTVKDGDGLRSYSLLKTQDLDEIVLLADPPEAKIARSLFIARGYMEKEMSSRAHVYLDRVLETDKDHPEALMMKVALLESEENEKRANWYRRRLGFATESAWRVIGPFANPEGEGFDIVYPPETEVNLEAAYETEWGNVIWEKHQDYNKNDGFVNFAEMFDEAEWNVAYAWTTVTAPEAGEVELRVGSDDDIKVWVNGIDVLIHQVGRAAEPDQDRVHVSLQQGVNQILVKVCNRELDWGFYLRFTDENRRPIEGLIYGE
ncbi:MAG: DUF3352 domain-containing protein [Candidatus Poribacteria bacterium]|nr:DUF3352 domain-containing protein [Candidatus Poribacteria bacterium]